MQHIALRRLRAPKPDRSVRAVFADVSAEEALRYGPITARNAEQPRRLSPPLTVWLYQFLAELAAGGATQEELRAAQDLLTASELGAFQEDLLKTMKAISSAIREILRDKGRKV